MTTENPHPVITDGLCDAQPATGAPPDGAADIARAASLIAMGNVASRVLGLARETVIAYLFGATGLVSAFDVASRVPRLLFDLLIDGLVSSALVPVFSDLAERDRDRLWQLASVMLSLTAIVMSMALLIMEIFAPQIAWLMSGGFNPQLQNRTADLVRLTSPAVVFLSLSGITTGLLYALKRFTLPAFTVTVFNASLVIMALLLTGWLGLGVESLAIGMLVGSAAQVALQLPGLRGAQLRFSLRWRHPDVRRILKLYAPVVLGLVVSQIGIVIDRNLASRTGEQSIAWMRYATTLVQFPLGLVSAAIAMAILPTLSRQAAAERGDTARSRSRRGAEWHGSEPSDPARSRSRHGTEWHGAEWRGAEWHGACDPEIRAKDPKNDDFMDTLARGLRMVWVLILPAVVGLFVLAKPVVALAFEHGDFIPFDTQQTALALRIYLLGTAFAAVDLPLVFAFYARQNTLTPALVGVLGVGVYLVAALVPALFRELRMTDLVLANSIQLTAHALVMLWLAHRIGSLRRRSLERTALKTVLASLVMGFLTYLSATWLTAHCPGDTLLGQVAVVACAALVGAIVYGAMVVAMRVEEVNTVLALVRRLCGRCAGYRPDARD